MIEEFCVFGLAGLDALESESSPDDSGAGAGAGTGEAVQEHVLRKMVKEVKRNLAIFSFSRPCLDAKELTKKIPVKSDV